MSDQQPPDMDLVLYDPKDAASRVESHEAAKKEDDAISDIARILAAIDNEDSISRTDAGNNNSFHAYDVVEEVR